MEKITPEEITKIFEGLRMDIPERKGYILRPSIEGFDVFEIDQESIKQYLTVEALKAKHKKEK